MGVPNNEALIRVRNVHKKYGDQVILHDVSFDIAPQQIVGVIGPNGAGKSTLVNIVLGFDTDYDGSVDFLERLRIAYVPQFSNADIYALPLSVHEFLRSAANQYYGLEKAAEKQTIIETLRHVGLDEEYMEHNVYSLSGGQRQRVLIARALLSDPDFIVLDEPLASVDYAARDALYELLKHLNGEHGITMMLISHDVDSIVAICDSVLCLNKTLHHGCRPTGFTAGEVSGCAMRHRCHT